VTEAGVLHRAIDERQWETAALCLLVAVAEAANRLPPQAIEGMLELLAASATTSRQRRKKR
jgi:hypothetical protein